MDASSMPRRNAEGYIDPTAHDALEPIQREQDESDQRLSRLIRSLKALIDLADYDLLDMIALRDRRHGRVY